MERINILKNKLVLLLGWLTLIFLLSNILVFFIYENRITILDLLQIIIIFLVVRFFLINLHNDLAEELFYKKNYKGSLNHYLLLTLIQPNNYYNYYNIALMYFYLDLYEKALFYFKLVLKINESYIPAYSKIGKIYQELGSLDEAISLYEKALSIKKDFEIYSNIGLVYSEKGLYEKSYQYLRIGYLLKRGIPINENEIYLKENNINLSDIEVRDNRKIVIGKNKLRHDIEQLEFLLNKKLLPENYYKYVSNYKSLLNELECSNSSKFLFNINKSKVEKILDIYDKNIYYENINILGSVLNRNNYSLLEDDFLRKKYGYISFDNFLTLDALEGLRNFCLNSTIWHDYEKKEGYIGSYMDDGFNCKILYKLAEELKNKFPNIFSDLSLTYMWAYKYESDKNGFKIHADKASINVNFWITPDSANKDLDSGGMLLYYTDETLNWNYNNYNIPTKKIEMFINKKNYKRVEIPYKQNRVIIFDGRIFHETSDFYFKDGYENKRINITMLFGNK